MEDTINVKIEDLETSNEAFIEESKNEETTAQMLTEPNYEVESEKTSSGNLHIMIIVVAVCAIIGLVLGIISGKKAAK